MKHEQNLQKMVGNLLITVGFSAENVGNFGEIVGNSATAPFKHPFFGVSHNVKFPARSFSFFLWLSFVKMWEEIHKMWETPENPPTDCRCNNHISAVRSQASRSPQINKARRPEYRRRAKLPETIV
ncbi:MAG: hypothetical protein ILO53_01985 [Clostridia bacterium]|nr:hypothetical protein [Clostridia bacterium]